jgi:hypothetical protein
MNSRTLVIRRPTPEQGQALEFLGHAIDYLVDSYPMWLYDGEYSPHFAAIVILKKANLEVFAECQVSQAPQSVFARLWKRLPYKFPMRHRRHPVLGDENVHQDKKGSISKIHLVS